MTERQALKAQLEAAVLAEMERVGPGAFDKAVIWRQFKSHGAGRSTIYRWMDELLKSGRVGRHLARKLREAAADRASRTDDPAADTAQAAAAALLGVVRPEDIAHAGGVLPAIEKLHSCIRTAEQVMAHARTADGRVRNAKMLLAASEHVRRNVESLIRIRQAVMDLAQLERFHEAIFDVLREESPELVERVVMRLQQLSAQWSAA